jgi:iron complex transport system permease protein
MNRISLPLLHALPLTRPKGSILIFLFFLLIGSILFATMIGAVAVPLPVVVQLILNQLPFVHLEGWEASQEIIILTVRLPRVLLAALIGGGLSISGAAMQGLFRNPMADPGVIGLSGGAALGAVISLASGLAFHHHLILPAFAFAGALGTVLLVYRIATRDGKTPVTTFLLSGMAVGIFMVSMLSLILSRISSVAVVGEILFWLMGGLDARGWIHLKVALGPILLGSVGLLFFARDLNLLSLEGEEGSAALGMRVKSVQRILLILSSLVTGAAVAFTGTIAFVGLIVPHVIRLLLGPDHRVLLPASFLAGGIFLVAADLLARVMVSPEELRLGTITSLIGVPFFLYLLHKGIRDGAR